MKNQAEVTSKPGPRRHSNLNRASLWTVCLAIPLTLLIGPWSPVPTDAQTSATRFEKTATPQKATAMYSCPMHPEVKSKKRGKCPKCKMTLRLEEPETPSATRISAGPDSNAVSRTVDEFAATESRVGASALVGSTRKMVIPDVDVLDQNGNRIHFYSDLIKGKTIAINFIFTNCTTICPPLAATFARVQKQMGDRVGKDVHFISISVDPLTDTPERLKAWGAKFKAGDGWTFVTGPKEEMDKLLDALGASVSRREDHSPALIVGNDLKGVWTRTYGLAAPSQIVGLIQKVMEGKADESLSKEPEK